MASIPDIIIAVDGFSSTGKSTFAKMVAGEFGFLYLDSGAMYRGVTLFAMENGLVGADGKIDEEALLPALEGLDLHFEREGGLTKLFCGERCIEAEPGERHRICEGVGRRPPARLLQGRTRHHGRP